jgi:hypothetical protein
MDPWASAMMVLRRAYKKDTQISASGGNASQSPFTKVSRCWLIFREGRTEKGKRKQANESKVK